MLLESIPGRPDPYLDSLQIDPRVIPKYKILFLIPKFNFITEKSNKLKYIKAIFSGLPPDLELDLLEQDPTVQPNF